MIALLAIQPWLVPLLLVAGLPLLLGVMKAGQAMFGLHMRMTSVTRARNYLYRLLTAKDPAKEVRAFGLGGYLNGADLADMNAMQVHRRRIVVTRAAIGRWPVDQ